MGFAVQLAGGADLVREPRCGRNFEYVSEDPLLTGLIAGAAIDGIQSQGVVSTLKHFALNAQETGRVIVSSDIGEAHLRESDLLAFEIALEQGRPRRGHDGVQSASTASRHRSTSTCSVGSSKVTGATPGS